MHEKAVSLAFLMFLIAGSAVSLSFAHCPVFGGGIGVAGPISTFSAPTLPAGRLSVGVRTDIIEFDPLSDQALEQAAMESRSAHSMERQQVSTLGLAYGISDDLTLGASLPYVQREGIKAVHEDGLGMMVHDLGRADGVGDLSLFAQYRFLRNLHGMDTALLVGVKTPTGVTDRMSGEVRLPTEHQPGTGSWDPFAGVAVSRRFSRFSLHGNISYALTTEGAKQTEVGDQAQANLAAVYRLGGKENYGDCDEIYEYFYPESRRRWLFGLVLEGNGQWQEKSKTAGVVNDSWGGTVLYVSPGFHVSYDGRVSLSASFGAPVYQDLNGEQSKADYRIIAGISTVF